MSFVELLIVILRDEAKECRECGGDRYPQLVRAVVQSFQQLCVHIVQLVWSKTLLLGGGWDQIS